MRFFSVVALFFLFVGFSHSSSQAASLLVENGKLVGARDVLIGARLFEVEFRDESCIAVFDGCDEAGDFLFVTQDEAQQAGIALLTQVLIDTPLGNFDTQPDTVFGCDFFADCLIRIPFSNPRPRSTGIDLGFAAVGNGRNGFGGLDDISFGPLVPRDIVGITSNFAVFSVAQVPLPATIGLFAPLFAVFVWMARARRHAG